MVSEGRQSAVAILIVLIGLSITMAFVNYIDIQYGEETVSYNPVDATIITTDIEGSGDEGFELDLKYEYIINLYLYRNDLFSACAPNYDTKEEAYTALAEYSVGQTITVYYNPKNPADSVIIRGCDASAVFDKIDYFLALFVIFTSFLIYVLVPVVKEYSRFRQVLNKGILNNQPDGSQKKYESFTPAQYMISSDERLSRFYQRFRWNRRIKISSFLSCVLFGVHEIAVYVMIFGYSSIIKYSAIIGYYPRSDLVFNVCAIIMAISSIFLLIFMLRDKSNDNSKLSIIIVYPIIYALISLTGIIALFVMFLPALIILGLLSLILYFPLQQTLDNFIGLSDNQELYLFSICVGIWIITINFIEIRFSRVHSQYSILKKGDTHFSLAYSNRNSELYCVSYSEKYVMMGDIQGNLILLNEYSESLPDRIALHSNSILKIITWDDWICTISLDNSLKISRLVDQHFKTYFEHLFDSTPLCVELFGKTVYVGLSDGRLAKFARSGENWDLLSINRVSQTPISKIQVTKDDIVILTQKKLILINQKTNIETSRSLKSKNRITDMVIYNRSILLSSLSGEITVFDKNNPKLSISHKITRDDEGLTRLRFSGNTLLAGSTEGRLYKIKTNGFEVENKFGIHSLWVEDIAIQENSVFTVSSDGTMKMMSVEIEADDFTLLEIISGDENCDVCKFTILGDQDLAMCYYCHSYFHIDHLVTYLQQRKTDGRDLKCSVCKAKFREDFKDPKTSLNEIKIVK